MDENEPPYECEACGCISEFLIANMWIWPIVFCVCEKCDDKMPDIMDENEQWVGNIYRPEFYI